MTKLKSNKCEKYLQNGSFKSATNKVKSRSENEDPKDLEGHHEGHCVDSQTVAVIDDALDRAQQT